MILSEARRLTVSVLKASWAPEPQKLCVLSGWDATSAKCQSARRIGRAKWSRGERWNDTEPETVGGVIAHVCVCVVL